MAKLSEFGQRLAQLDAEIARLQAIREYLVAPIVALSPRRRVGSRKADAGTTKPPKEPTP